MSPDSVFIAFTVSELQSLLNSKIEKIIQPDSDRVVMTLRNNGCNYNLLLCIRQGEARVQLTDLHFQAQENPSALCMLLRKHLISSRITEILQPGFDRIIEFKLSSRNELGDSCELRLITELTGRCCNIILVAEDGRIIDAVRRTGFSEAAGRSVLPGMYYKYPQRPIKTPFSGLGRDGIEALISGSDITLPFSSFLKKSFCGISPLNAELIDECAGEDLTRLKEILCSLADRERKREFYIVLSEKIGDYYTYLRPSSVKNIKAFDSPFKMLDCFYAEKEAAALISERTSTLLSKVSSIRQKTEKRLANRKADYIKTLNREDIRKKADLITANLWRIKKGDAVLVCEDYFEEGMPEIRITLDSLKSPQKYAADLYKQYNKLKTANEMLQRLMREDGELLDYLDSVISEIKNADSPESVEAIKSELIHEGLITSPGKKKTTKAFKPLKFTSSDGYEIFVGRNNLQNDELTFRTSARNDIWLHVKAYHGSHVIISCGDTEPPESTLIYAAKLALKYSQLSSAGRGEVDYTKIKNVKKAKGALPGRVLYYEYKTLNVTL